MKTNSQLILGIVVIIAGLVLLVYSIASYAEVRTLSGKIDFDELDNNNRIPTSEKYYKYLSISDYLNQSLTKNKNLPIKNVSCVYVDYAQHNTVSLYNLIYKGNSGEESKREVVEGNIKYLSEMLGSYKMCRRTAEYKKELDDLLEEIDKTDRLRESNQMFINQMSGVDEENDLNDEELNSENNSGGEGLIERKSDYTDEDISDNASTIERVGE